MFSKYPYKNLIKYSFWFSISVAISAFITYSTSEYNLATVAYRTTSIFCHFFIISFFNVLLINKVEKWDCKHNNINIQLSQFLTGYLMTIILVSLFYLINLLFVKMGYLSQINFDERYSKIKEDWHLVIFIPYVSLLLYSVVYFFHNFILLHHTKVKNELEVAELKSLHSETINQLLRQQIQPHFLFNALNTLKSLIKKDPELADQYVIHLSEFLRASIADNRNQISKIEEELKICTDYMNMQKIRFTEALIYKVEIDMKDSRMQRSIPNFSLQPLLENAIKHNQFTLSNPLEIKVFFENDFICISNPIRLRKTVEHSTGNGLYNLQQRCRIIYEEDIEILNNGETFTVKIKLI